MDEVACARIVAEIINRVNAGQTVTFEPDIGENTMTVSVSPDDGHTHVGYPNCPVEVTVKNLHGALVGTGPHLSWSV